MKNVLLFVLCLLIMNVSSMVVINSVTATDAQITIKYTLSGYTKKPKNVIIFENYYNGSSAQVYSNSSLPTLYNKSYTISLARVNSSNRDISYSSFFVRVNYYNSLGQLLVQNSNISYATTFNFNTQNKEPFPTQCSKKGLLGLDISSDDYRVLKGSHVENCANLEMMSSKTTNQGTTMTIDGTTYNINLNYFTGILDPIVKAASNSGAVVYLALQHRPEESIESGKDSLTHPDYVKALMGAINTVTPGGMKKYRAITEFIAERYSRPKTAANYCGRVNGYIVGNEIDIHWDWYNMGNKKPTDVVNDYLRTVRMTNAAIMKYNLNARIYICLANRWNTPGYGTDTLKGLKGRYLVDEFNNRAKAEGNFNWNIAYHPYPADAWESTDTWNDGSRGATNDVTSTLYITPKNIHLLRDYLKNSVFLFNSKARRIICAEQGFLTKTSSDYQTQAAAFAYTYYKIMNLEGIDAFVYYLYKDANYVDQNGTTVYCNFGLVTTTGIRKDIYNVYKFADKPTWKVVCDPLLSVMGYSSWNAVLEGVPSDGFVVCPGDYNTAVDDLLKQ